MDVLMNFWLAWIRLPLLSVHIARVEISTTRTTLLDCRAWFWKRYELYNVLDFELGDIDPPDLEKILRAVLCGQQEWAALKKFAEEVMSAKEQAERDRQGIG
ncbi:hypothetical protein P5V15_015819 [Pogonomyrmex californicus]